MRIRFERKISSLNTSLILVIIALMSIRIKWFMLATQACFLLFSFSYLYNNPIKKRQLTYVKCLMAFLLFSGVSVLWAENTTKYIAAMEAIIQIFVISILIYLIINSPERFELVSESISWAGWAILGYIFVATPLNTWKDMIKGTDNLSSTAGRLGPTIGMHTNMCGSVLSCMMIFSTYQYFQKKEKKYLIQLILLIICLMFTKSRAALIGSVIGAFLFVSINQKLGAKQILKILLFASFLIALIWLSFNNGFLYSLFGRRVESLLNFVQNKGKTDASVTGRMLLQEKAKEVFYSHPIIGVGMGNFSHYNDISGSVGGLYAHNNYLEMLSDLGIIGFSIYYLPFLICGYQLFNCIKNVNEQHRSLYAAFFTILIMRLITDFAQVSYLYDSTQIFLAISFAAIKVSHYYKG